MDILLGGIFSAWADAQFIIVIKANQSTPVYEETKSPRTADMVSSRLSTLTFFGRFTYMVLLLVQIVLVVQLIIVL